MTRVLATFLIGLSVSVCSFVPALAEEGSISAPEPAVAPSAVSDAGAATTNEVVNASAETTTADGTTIAAAPTPSKKKSKQASSSSGSGMGGVKRVTAATVGFVGGIPVALVRKTYEASVDGVTDIVGQSTNPFFIVPASILSIPFGAVSGCLQAPVVSGYNAWKYSEDQPFSKPSFSVIEGN